MNQLPSLFWPLLMSCLKCADLYLKKRKMIQPVPVQESEWPTLSLNWYICSNASKQSSKALTLCHRNKRENTFCLYVGLSLHATDWQREAIVTFHALGMSVSFDHVMDVRRGFAQTVSKRWAEDGVVVPNNAKRKVWQVQQTILMSLEALSTMALP